MTARFSLESTKYAEVIDRAYNTATDGYSGMDLYLMDRVLSLLVGLGSNGETSEAPPVDDFLCFSTRASDSRIGDEYLKYKRHVKALIPFVW